MSVILKCNHCFSLPVAPTIYTNIHRTYLNTYGQCDHDVGQFTFPEENILHVGIVGLYVKIIQSGITSP